MPRRSGSGCAGCPFVSDGSSTRRTRPEEEVASVTEVGSRQIVTIVLRHLAVAGEQVDVTSDVPPICELRLKRVSRHMSTVCVHGEEVDVVVFGVKRVLCVPLIESAVLNAAQQQTFIPPVRQPDSAKCTLSDPVTLHW